MIASETGISIMELQGIPNRAPNAAASAEAGQILREGVRLRVAPPADAPLPEQKPLDRTETEVDRRKLVLQPPEVPVAERLEQVMSLEEVQQLLLLRSPIPERPTLRSLFTGDTGDHADFRG